MLQLGVLRLWSLFTVRYAEHITELDLLQNTGNVFWRNVQS